MPAHRLHLKAGVDVDQALAVLRNLVTEAGGVTGRAMPEDVESLQREYMVWVELAEMQLAGLTRDRSVGLLLRSALVVELCTRRR